MARAKVLNDKDGNRLIFPAHVQHGVESDLDDSTIICDVLMKSVALGLHSEEGWYEFEAADFPHFETYITHAAFKHGGASVLIFGGPKFDEYNANASKEK